ncbi:Ventricular zone-expressed PH domain-containing protein 1 [Saguinus oedipus]|uniref:Ventricular zone-expressed PH domain-containing protein 1 n=1 Tax=Saguinus oedipus TaxID=9490 RepID=A0ABQ9U1M6_SAGOE|nr:Ventricular zone-expressed PH domain-containing protein 1 [Saguinus oedipus]
MHQLFRLVLGQKDLSRAGDLFSLDDSEIEDSLTEALEQIKIISSSSEMDVECPVWFDVDLLDCTWTLYKAGLTSTA